MSSSYPMSLAPCVRLHLCISVPDRRQPISGPDPAGGGAWWGPIGLVVASMRDGEVVDSDAFERLPEAEQVRVRADIEEL